MSATNIVVVDVVDVDVVVAVDDVVVAVDVDDIVDVSSRSDRQKQQGLQQ